MPELKYIASQRQAPKSGRTSEYRGRFAPSPTGPLHAGSLVAAMASRLDALAHGGRWLLRIEDIDSPRVAVGATDAILATLEAFGFGWDGPVMVQSLRHEHYAAAFERLLARGLVYPCACSRKEIADSLAGRAESAAAVYPGTCREGLPAGKTARAWRIRVTDTKITFHDRHTGACEENLARTTGDFILKRADGAWAYQLAVVVDDADQGVTDVVRGADLLGSTARQIYLQQQLGLPTPYTLHVPVLRNEKGEKLSKQTGAAALRIDNVLAELHRGAQNLGLTEVDAQTVDDFWAQASRNWAKAWLGGTPV